MLSARVPGRGQQTVQQRAQLRQDGGIELREPILGNQLVECGSGRWKTCTR
jgi:hypothetical protein